MQLTEGTGEMLHAVDLRQHVVVIGQHTPRGTIAALVAQCGQKLFLEPLEPLRRLQEVLVLETCG